MLGPGSASALPLGIEMKSVHEWVGTWPVEHSIHSAKQKRHSTARGQIKTLTLTLIRGTTKYSPSPTDSLIRCLFTPSSTARVPCVIQPNQRRKKKRSAAPSPMKRRAHIQTPDDAKTEASRREVHACAAPFSPFRQKNKTRRRWCARNLGDADGGDDGTYTLPTGESRYYTTYRAGLWENTERDTRMGWREGMWRRAWEEYGEMAGKFSWSWWRRFCPC
jgi:hypothetical protein